MQTIFCVLRRSCPPLCRANLWWNSLWPKLQGPRNGLDTIRGIFWVRTCQLMPNHDKATFLMIQLRRTDWENHGKSMGWDASISWCFEQTCCSQNCRECKSASCTYSCTMLHYLFAAPLNLVWSGSLGQSLWSLCQLDQQNPPWESVGFPSPLRLQLREGPIWCHGSSIERPMSLARALLLGKKYVEFAPFELPSGYLTVRHGKSPCY